METQLVTPGHVDRVYFGYREMPQKTLRQDSAYCMIDYAGAGNEPKETGQMRTKLYRIIVEIGVKWTTSEDALDLMVDKWDELEDVVYEAENQHLIIGPERQMDLVNLFDVDAGFLFATDNPSWRYSRSIVEYKEIFCQRSWV